MIAALNQHARVPRPGSNNFQFEKPIPHSKEVMRIEFMAPEEFKREKDFRVDVDKGVHARFCIGGSIAITESSVHRLSGSLPDGSALTASVRVTNAHALVMLKLLALDDRYRNIRGPGQERHDREEAQTHAADCIAVITGQLDLKQFKENFETQFARDQGLGVRVLKILDQYFRENTSPGFLVYEESIVAGEPLDRMARERVASEIKRAHRMMLDMFPPREFYEMTAAIEDSCNFDQNARLVEDFLRNLQQTGTKINNPVALERLPAEAFGGAFRKGEQFLTNVSDALKVLNGIELSLLGRYLADCAIRLNEYRDLLQQFGLVLS